MRPPTFLGYETLLTRHVLPTLGKRRLTKLSAHDIDSLYNEKLASGLSAQTVKNLHAVLHSALEQAVRTGLIVRNVCDLIDPPRAQKFEIQPLDSDQSRALLRAAQGDKLEALYVLALTTGMRQGELLGLKWADVDLVAGSLKARRAIARLRGHGLVESEPKSSTSRRGITLAPLAVEALKQHRERQTFERRKAADLWQDGDLVFCNGIGRPLEAGNMKRRSYWPLLKRAGLPHVRFHDLRHSAATLLFSLGVHPKIVQELLGHSQIGLTLDTYSHAVPGLQHEAVGRLGDLLSNSR